MGEPSAPPADPGHIAADLRLAVARIARRLRQQHEVGDLTLAEVSVLSRLDRDGPSTPGALAEQERIRPQAMATTLTTLTDRGLVRRRPDAADGRKALMNITAAGRALLGNRRDESIQRLTEVLTGDFTQAEQRKFAAMVPLLDRLADRL